MFRVRTTMMAVCCLLAGASVAELHGSGESMEGRRFYYDKVLPQLAQNGCPSCHAVGYMHPNVTVYEEILRRLAIGDSPTNNAVIYKIANLRSIAPNRPEHPGGQRCATVDSEPCASIQQWWQIEFGADRASGSAHHE